jgi:anthranilate synthase component 1
VSPSLDEFLSLSGYDSVVVSAEVSSDIETPVSAFMKLRNEGPCFLLESAESGRMWGRYSFLGFEPGAIVRLERGRLTVSENRGDRELPGNPVRGVFDILDGVRVYAPGDEMPFAGGAVGYFGYDSLPYLEKVNLRASSPGLPELMFMLPTRLVMFDHLRSRIRLCRLVGLGGTPVERKLAYEEAVSTIAAMASDLDNRLPPEACIPVAAPSGGDFDGARSNLTRRQFSAMVARAREYILAGDAFQVVLSQRFAAPFTADPLTVYRYLRAENPSPYMFYLELPGLTLAGSSPEPLVTNRAGHTVIRPIAGTRPRGSDAASDASLAKELEKDLKERAEHIMLVDLARNDLGRVSRPGTVRVTKLMDIEKYSHVMHMVSEVEGTLRNGCGNFELLRAAFPAGTVVGAPKVRASEIVDELEPDGRGPYAGAIGYLSYSGDMDTCIAIRTVLFRDGLATVQAGAGIVADSSPEREYEETRNKARALLRAVRAAREVQS